MFIYIPLCFYLYGLRRSRKVTLIYLHSTMFLLILIASMRWFISSIFTFHYVSTYTETADCIRSFPLDLHSTMFLLIPVGFIAFGAAITHLHSTMFLLIRLWNAGIRCKKHNLHSTMFLLILNRLKRLKIIRQDLHSTMFLLILCRQGVFLVFIFDLHSTMFLLIQRSTLICSTKNHRFTFHYVSTYTATVVITSPSTLFIYIPLCFYLYSAHPDPRPGWYSFTFHYVSTYTKPETGTSGIYHVFTFHYVSTYTYGRYAKKEGITNLHSTMFLLIRISDACKSDIRCNLHSTMFLLIRVANLATALIATFTFHYVSTYTGATPKQASDIDIFTFHYVSTYTVCRSCSPSPDSHLHSTMFLLIHGRPRSH